MTELLKKYLPSIKVEFIILIILQIAQGVLNLYLPDLQANIIDEGVVKLDQGRITSIGWTMVIIIITQVILAVAAVVLAARISSRIAYQVRRDFFQKAQYLSQEQVEQFGAGSLITRATNDVQQVQRTLFGVLLFVMAKKKK